MSGYECGYEDRVVSTVLSGAWPGDDNLAAHAEHCPICREVVDIAVVLRADHDQARREVQVPVAGQVWWRSAVRARLESTESATRPMTWLHGVTAAITIGIMLAAIGMAWPSIAGAAVWARELMGPLVTDGALAGAVAGVLRQSALIALAAAACLVIAPVLLYFALSSD